MNFIVLTAACSVLFSTNVLGQWAVDDDGCITPFRNSGSCVEIHNCNPILSFLTSKSLSQSDADLLRRYQCGFQSNNVKVCCPRDRAEIARLEGTTTTTTSTTSTNNQNSDPEPPDVSTHRNLALLPEECGRIDINQRILNGNVTGLFEFPWMALLSYRLASGPDFRCGGTIINNRYILTAAHCITGLKYPLLGVRVGEHDLRTRRDCETFKNKTTCAPPVQDIGIGQAIPHPQYSKTLYNNDIGLIRLASPINFAENAVPICLPTTRQTARYAFSGRKVIVTGFGATETGRNSPTLLKVQIPYVERSQCMKVYEKAAPIDYRQLCAGGQNNQDSCGGDSGGPLQVAAPLNGEPRYVQQGITSFGPRKCGAEGNPGVYTKVAYYMDWILDNISP